MAKDIDELTTWREAGIRAVVKDEIKDLLDDPVFTEKVRKILKREEPYENPGITGHDETDVEVQQFVAIFRRFPKSIIWMLSGFLIGLGIGHLFASVGIFGAILSIAWLAKEGG